MSKINEKYIEELKEFEYRFRDGLYFTREQQEEIKNVCRQIISLTE